MGSWNHTCSISNLHVLAGQDVAVFMLARNNSNYGTPWAVCPIPFYGKYDDYGGVDECHGEGMNIVVEAIRSQLYELGEGANQYHECEVRKDSFDIDVLFKADQADRLFVEDYPFAWDADDYARRKLEEQASESTLSASQQFELDRLANAISRKVDPRRRVTHVVVHQAVLDEIMANWYIEDYVGEGNGTTGYGKSYNHVYFKDVIDSVPEFIERLKTAHREKGILPSRSFSPRSLDTTLRNEFDYNSTCYAGRYLAGLVTSSEKPQYALIDIGDTVSSILNKEDLESLERFVRELLVGFWVNSFMNYTRKTWVSTKGRGSQSQEHLGYTVLANAVLKVLKDERKEWDEDDIEVGDAAS